MTSASDATLIESSNPPQAAADDRDSRRTFWDSPLTWLLVLLGLGLVLPFVAVPNPLSRLVGMVLLVTVYTVAVVQMVVQFARYDLPKWKVGIWFIAVLGLWIALEFFIMPVFGPMVGSAARAHGGAPPLKFLVPWVALNTVHDTAMLSAAGLGGMLLSALISEASMMAPICVLIALIDIWGVMFGGIVSQMLEKAPVLSTRVMTGAPMVGGALGHAASKFVIKPPDIGAGDYLFLGMLFAALVTNKMNWRGAVKAVTPLMILALLSIPLSWWAFHADFALPGLLFIGLGVAIPNRKFFVFTQEEKVALKWAGLFVVFLTAGLRMAAPFIVAKAQNMDGGAKPMQIRDLPQAPRPAAKPAPTPH